MYDDDNIVFIEGFLEVQADILLGIYLKFRMALDCTVMDSSVFKFVAFFGKSCREDDNDYQTFHPSAFLVTFVH
jgi:hypothetical protein